MIFKNPQHSFDGIGDKMQIHYQILTAERKTITC